MSLRVLLVCENHRKDPPMLLPIIRQLVADAGRPKCKIEINTAVTVHGWSQALDENVLRKVVNRYKQADLIILCIDRDGEPNRHLSLARVETKIAPDLVPRQGFFGEHAIEEVEVWVMAGLLDLKRPWKEIRETRDAKEALEEHAKHRGLEPGLPVRVRESLGTEAAQNYARIRQLCEEVRRLEDRIRDWLATRP